jgi:DNA-binding response OmpR family regulator
VPVNIGGGFMKRLAASSISPSILLADGDSSSREVFGRFFRQAGWHFDVVTESSQICSAIKGQEYDIVIADVAMPGAGGLTLLTEILAMKPGQAIIAVSRDNSFDEALKFFRSGAMDLLAPPIDFPWLERVIKQVVDDKIQDARERQLYRYVTSERTEMRFTCRQLAELDTVSMPILERLLMSGLLDSPAELRMRLAVQEAVVNALEHGNLELQSEWKEEILPDGTDRFATIRRERLQDPDYANRSVTVCTWFDGSRIEVVVRDQGKGFLNRPFGETIKPGHGVACSGRGLAMISSAVDEVKFAMNGAEVIMTKFVTR